ncbi:hypothetical protein [Thiohalocapsa halophila]|uniref:hypothetical protein n=1 Tax=Thiohalocapsa halophila TaxID=69359 RepID=UPI0019060D4B|nr:hypothetical protein [Thiohalocapsa halophila]
MPKPTSHTRTDAARAFYVARASSPGKPSSTTASTPEQASAPDASDPYAPGQDGLATQQHKPSIADTLAWLRRAVWSLPLQDHRSDDAILGYNAKGHFD